MPAPGQELQDPVTGALLRFVATAASTEGALVRMRLSTPSGWSAGPPHVHPRQIERLRVLAGAFEADFDGTTRRLGLDDELEVPPETRHTITLVDAAGELEVEFAPALRTDEMFETMYRARFPRRPPAFVPSVLRAWIESRGFGDEIRFLWPRRAAFAVLAVIVGAAALAVSTRR